VSLSAQGYEQFDPENAEVIQWLNSLGQIKLYLTHWLRYQKGIGVASSAALYTLRKTLQSLCSEATDVMIPTFSNMLMKTFQNQQQNIINENTHIKKSMVSVSSKLRSFSNDVPQPSSCHSLI
jgi:GMP synthase PP-ATPase subunit